MRYEAQLAWKLEVVRRLLCDSGFTDPPLLPAVPCDDPWHYRNHMRFSVNRGGQPGLTARGTHYVLPLSDCPIAHEYINRALAVLSRHVNARPQLLIRCGAASGQVLIQPEPATEVAQELEAAGLDLRSETMEEFLAGETFRIRPSSFFQTNTAQAEKMARMVLDGLLASGEQPENRRLTIVDAYCGVGTSALLLARRAGRVIAIEESASAIKDAQWNLRDALIRHPVARIVYVSCDPATLARDLNILCRLHPTYRLRSVQPLDMFPQTAHIECVAVLERCNI